MLASQGTDDQPLDKLSSKIGVYSDEIGLIGFPNNNMFTL
jgi:hypothetical protein